MLQLPIIIGTIASFVIRSTAQDTASSPWGNADFHDKEPIRWGPHKDKHIVFRNVRDFGAKGDGSNATEAFNRAIFGDGTPSLSGVPPIIQGVADDPNAPVCAVGCNSSTVQPVLIYVPPGEYNFNAPIVLPYMTNLIGDAVSRPLLKLAEDFKGDRWFLDTNKYTESGNWFINQNNFYRQIRNLRINITDVRIPEFAAIHWQVAQATTLQNIDIIMSNKPDTSQIGIFSENGSGGFMADLNFTGGAFGAKLGSQQYTSRNLRFDGCKTAIQMLWTWCWVFHGLHIQGAQVGLSMIPPATDTTFDAATNASTIGTITVLDSHIDAQVAGIANAWKPDLAGKTDDPSWNSSLANLVLDNVEFANKAVIDLDGTEHNPPKFNRFIQGSQFQGTSVVDGGSGEVRNGNMQKSLGDHGTDPLRPGEDGTVYAQSKPSYDQETFFALAKDDPDNFKRFSSGSEDASVWLQRVIDQTAKDGHVLYVNYGVYLLSNSLLIPDGAKIMGELWPNFMIEGSKFSDESNPKPVIQIGNDGDQGKVEISDIIITTKGPALGAIAMQWGLNSCYDQPCIPRSGLWDVHIRIGGAEGTDLTRQECEKKPLVLNSAGKMQGMQYLGPDTPNPCGGVHTMFHASPKSGGLYMENNWFWVADHDFEDLLNYQIDIFSHRGVFIESSGGPVWMWGTASEHSVLYNYQFRGAKDVFMGFTQVESPYFQPLVTALVTVTPDKDRSDPAFTTCSAQGVTTTCIETWGLRMLQCENIQMYGLGFYAFFNNYRQQNCIDGINCQQNMIDIDAESTKIALYGVSTIAAVNILTYDGQSVAKAADFQSMFVQALAMWSSPN